MFRVDLQENRILKLDQKRFSDFGLRERTHLQQWMADTPDALGEELLIIQQEFDGFADTRERLDLLALDKSGQLVIIENKLDDTGRDVVWQALKYAAYCSTLKKAQVLDIFQRYLDRHGDGGDAETKISEFLDEDSLDEVVLNSGTDQRIIFIAANFRREVTAAVLWLIDHRVRAQCFRVIPYGYGEELFIDLQQIIPTPEAVDFMISMAEKEDEEESLGGAQRRSHEIRAAFWERALEALSEQGVSLYQNISPSKDHWLSAGTGISGCVYSLHFLRTEARVLLDLQRSSKEENKWLFDRLKAQREQLERDFGGPLEWRRMDDKKSSRIDWSRSFDSYNKEVWPEIAKWLAEHVRRLEVAFKPRLQHLNRELKARGGPPQDAT
ncbi:MAG: DUF4268 domain-containing protein [Spirochaetaceae bacterium]|nr:DUF4268 domain-containing protein [Spirochaetaceae bacterium]